MRADEPDPGLNAAGLRRACSILKLAVRVPDSEKIAEWLAPPPLTGRTKVPIANVRFPATALIEAVCGNGATPTHFESREGYLEQTVSDASPARPPSPVAAKSTNSAVGSPHAVSPQTPSSNA